MAADTLQGTRFYLINKRALGCFPGVKCWGGKMDIAGAIRVDVEQRFPITGKSDAAIIVIRCPSLCWLQTCWEATTTTRQTPIKLVKDGFFYFVNDGSFVSRD